MKRKPKMNQSIDPEKNIFQTLIDGDFIWMYLGELVSADNNITNKQREDNVKKLNMIILGMQVVEADEETINKIKKMAQDGIDALRSEIEREK